MSISKTKGSGVGNLLLQLTTQTNLIFQKPKTK